MSEFTTTTERRVAIVEDHGALRIFLRDVLQRYGWTVTGVAGTAETGCELVVTTDPDVAVVDLHLASEGGGDALIRRLAESAASTKVVVFTATTDPTELHAVLKAGADGIVLKEGGLPELLAGLDAVTRGEQYLSPSLAAVRTSERTSEGGGRHGAPDDAGDRDERQHVRQRLEERRRRRRNSGRRCASARETPNSSVAANSPRGLQRPKIIAASAMNPRPAVMFCVNECTKPMERNAPPRPRARRDEDRPVHRIGTRRCRPSRLPADSPPRSAAGGRARVRNTSTQTAGRESAAPASRFWFGSASPKNDEVLQKAERDVRHRGQVVRGSLGRRRCRRIGSPSARARRS